MTVEGVGVGESALAHQARLQVLSRVGSHMVLELLLLREHHATHLTRLSLFAWERHNSRASRK
jgi:hypothetical protein